MNRVLKWIVWIAMALVVIVIGGAYLLPGEAVVQRQIVISAPPDKVFAIAGHMRRFNEWSPWADLDPATEYTFEGPETGTGQKMTWRSANPDVGSGSQTIISFEDNRRTVTELDFGGMGKARASLELAPVGGNTAVTWGFKTELNGIMERWLGLMFDRWIGADYEKGLLRLKAAAENSAAG